MRRIVAVSVLALTLVAPSARAQTVETFRQLPLLINRDDVVRVLDQAGTKVTGRVASFARDGLTLRTDAGDRRISADAVRRLDLSSSSKARGALIGAGTMLVVGLVGCPKDSATGCPVFASLLWGAPLGSLIGAWVPSMHTVFRAPTSRSPITAPTAGNDKGSLLEDLGLRVNRGDKLTVETVSGASSTGSLTLLDDDWLTICSGGPCGNASLSANYAGGAAASRIDRNSLRRVSVTHTATRKATLIGFLAASVACLPSAGNDWPDAFVLCGSMGAGVGALIGVSIRRSTVVYPASESRASITPTVLADRMGIRASYHFQ